MSALATHARPAPRAPQRSQRPQLRLVAPPQRTARWLALLVVVTAVGVVGIVSLNALAAEAAFKAAELEAEVDTLAVRYDELTAEVARLQAPERVRRIATEELGMVPPEQPTYLVVDDAVPAAAFDPPGGRPPHAPAPQGPAAVADPVKSALGARR